MERILPSTSLNTSEILNADFPSRHDFALDDRNLSFHDVADETQSRGVSRTQSPCASSDRLRRRVCPVKSFTTSASTTATSAGDYDYNHILTRWGCRGRLCRYSRGQRRYAASEVGHNQRPPAIRVFSEPRW